MIQHTITLFELKELPEKVQQKAFEKWLSEEIDYFWQSENHDSLNAFCNIFHINWSEYDYSYQKYIHYHFEDYVEDSILEMSGHRLAKYLWNNFKSVIYSKRYYSLYRKEKHFSRYSNVDIYEDYNCPFTGYYMDNEILHEIWQFINNPDDRNYAELIDSCLNTWLTACQKDYIHSISFENFQEESALNEWYFTESGEYFYI